ncbi:PhoU domain-containing protein, partial [Mammaliicoccus sciuri]|uniref:PhoU domain-containing protein n=1 Tax=Mammaliicoccus sciuri TaxID=1296 RepID=UPI002274FBD6
VRQYLNRLSEKKLSAKDAERLSVLYDVNRTILKVSTLTESYLEELQKKQSADIQISSKAEESIERLYDHVKISYEKTFEVFDVYDNLKKDEVVKRSQDSYVLEHDLRKKHIKRLSSGECSPEGSLVYIDMISILERIGYHSRNISESMINLGEHSYTQTTEVKI